MVLMSQVENKIVDSAGEEEGMRQFMEDGTVRGEVWTQGSGSLKS